ncbi:MAG TPA: VWA domain-containing protein [Vicinamibacterales bacterium]|nr:VWA domain-containing protein [Vicinamibacterales bacterium]
MQSRATVLFVVVATAVEVLSARQAAQGRPQKPTQPYFAATTAILVDVVVRDRRGRPVLDLRADDFEVLEDAVRQTIGSFAVVQRGGGLGIKVGRRVDAPTTTVTGGTETAADPPSLEQPTVAIVFDALKPEALELAQKAALSYVPLSGDINARVGVFASDPALRVLQPYTDDMPLVRRAVRSVTAASNTKQEMEAERRQALNQRLASLDALGLGRDSRAFGPDGGNPTAAQALVEGQMAELELRMLRTFDSLDRDQRGFGTSTSLLAIVQSLAPLPGRKTIVYLSEGLPVSPTMQARLDSLVSAANRANVSVYTIDAAGLRAESTLAETRREVDAAGQERIRQTGTSRDPTDGPMMRIVERTEDLLRLDPHSGLARLAEDTGGFLIHDTNDLSSAFRRIDEDNRFHYLLTYSPLNGAFDGKFRTIHVNVKRDGMHVFARKGYLAVPPSMPPVMSYEAAALAALHRGTPPNAFPISATGFVFPEPKGRATVPVVVQVRTDRLQFDVDQTKQTYAAQVTVLAQIKNAAGDPVRTLSQQYVLSGAVTDLDAARNGEILFYRQPELDPGVYTLEAIVHDAVGNRASARLSTISVPDLSGGRTPLSTLVVVRRIEKIAAAERPANAPFYYGEVLLYPNAGDPLRKGQDTDVLFYFAFHRRPDTDPTAALDILTSGRAIASMPLDLPRTAETGRVQHVGKLPVGALPPGTYELRLRLRAGAEEELRSAYFTIAE